MLEKQISVNNWKSFESIAALFDEWVEIGQYRRQNFDVNFLINEAERWKNVGGRNIEIIKVEKCSRGNWKQETFVDFELLQRYKKELFFFWMFSCSYKIFMTWYLIYFKFTPCFSIWTSLSITKFFTAMIRT